MKLSTVKCWLSKIFQVFIYWYSQSQTVFRSGVSKLFPGTTKQGLGQSPIFVVLLEYSYAPQSLKYLLSGPLRKSLPTYALSNSNLNLIALMNFETLLSEIYHSNHYYLGSTMKLTFPENILGQDALHIKSIPSWGIKFLLCIIMN